jgi:integrase
MKNSAPTPPRHSGGRHNAAVARRRRRRGEGSVYKSEGGWIARYPLGSVNGRRINKRVRCKTERDALQELERLRRDYGGGGDPATGTLGQYLTAWLHGHRRSITDSTAISYEGHIRLHIAPLLGGIPLARLRPSDVRRLVDELERKRLSPGSIVRVVTTLRIALNAAVRDRLLVHNAADIRELPKVRRKPVRPLTHAEADQLLDAVAGEWIEPLVRVLLGSGMRRGEAIGLDQGDLMLEAGYVRVRISKTDVRAVPISDDAIDAFRGLLRVAPRIGPNEPVFFGPRKRTQRLEGSSVTHAMPRILERAGLQRLTPHALRHGAATLMLADGHPMRVIAEQLGHRNPGLTARIYAHVIPEAQRSAVSSLERRRAR